MLACSTDAAKTGLIVVMGFSRYRHPLAMNVAKVDLVRLKRNIDVTDDPL
jgi:hypothetical protein